MAADALRERIMKYAPRALAFTSLKAGRSVLGRKIGVGLQPDTFGSTQVWVLPSPSPAARKSWDAQAWHNLARALREIVPG
jgi:TDG/mug DNA glycosylase family protein